MNNFFDHIDHFYKLNEESRQAIEKVLHQQSFSKNTLLATEGKVCHHMYFVEKGCVRGYYNLDGKEVTYWFGFEYSFVTSFYSFISRKPAFENIQLIEDCTVLAISYDDLQKLYDKYPEVERLVRIINENYYVRLEERFVAAQFKTAKERYAGLLDFSPHILQRMPLGYIASYLGISQETLSRIRGKI
ncbi:MAG: Crp/Fnr family transcriptional regulator [Cytophagaceae bacterium]|nr:Crp/Fnr family transcriptional regulator [Cytophagaceae bacterium]